MSPLGMPSIQLFDRNDSAISNRHFILYPGKDKTTKLNKLCNHLIFNLALPYILATGNKIHACRPYEINFISLHPTRIS